MKTQRYTLIIFLLIVSRLMLAYTLPLTDKTEARYSEIARKMVETGDWITPQHEYDVPFWGKPPLSFWFSAIGIKLLGVNELGPRLLILITSVLFLGFFYWWLKSLLNKSLALLGVLLLLTSNVYYFSMAAVMTDMLLSVSVSTAMICFWAHYHSKNQTRRWEWGLYLAFACALMTKGLLSAILILLPIAVWTLLNKKISSVWKRFSWIKGFLAICVLVCPWHILAEIKTPGFLNYYIIGEHFKRYFVSGWTGDLYGFAHSSPFGLIWLFLLIGTLPWSIALPLYLVNNRKLVLPNIEWKKGLVFYCTIWSLVPLLFFTLSRNIIYPYTLPALPPLVVILVVICRNINIQTWITRISWFLIGTITLYLAVSQLIHIPLDKVTQKYIIESIKEDGYPLYYWESNYYSAKYYSEGKSIVIKDANTINPLLEKHELFYLIVKKKNYGKLPEIISEKLLSKKEIFGFYILSEK